MKLVALGINNQRHDTKLIKLERIDYAYYNSKEISLNYRTFFTSVVKTNGKNFPTCLLSTTNECLLPYKKEVKKAEVYC